MFLLTDSEDFSVSECRHRLFVTKYSPGKIRAVLCESSPGERTPGRALQALRENTAAVGTAFRRFYYEPRSWNHEGKVRNSGFVPENLGRPASEDKDHLRRLHNRCSGHHLDVPSVFCYSGKFIWLCHGRDAGISVFVLKSARKSRSTATNAHAHC